VKIPFWIDPALLLEIFENRELYSSSTSEKFISLLGRHSVECHISRVGWGRIKNVLENQSELASITLTKIEKLLKICEVEGYIYESMRSLPISDIESAIEVACAESLELGAIITHDIKKFSKSSLAVFSVEELLARLDPQTHSSSKSEFSFAIQSLNVAFCNKPKQLHLLHPSEVIDAFTRYRTRNSIKTVIEVFDVLRKDSSFGMTQQELALSSGHELGTIKSVIWDFQCFHMAQCDNGFIRPNKYFLDLGSHEIEVAEYICQVLKNHVITQAIYEDLPLGGVTTRENIKQLILRTKFDETQVSTKSANDYISRMLSWLYFSGLLEKKAGKRGTELICRPMGEGKQKGLLREEPVADQLLLQFI